MSYVSKIRKGKDDVSVILAFSHIVLLVGGGEGSRTPVRKSIRTTFYECSLSIKIPLKNADKQAIFLGISKVIHSAGEIRMNVHH